MINVKMLETYISKNFNILIQGKHGVGKTAKLVEACNNLGVSWEYLPASTLDPYIDFVGIPDIERTGDGKHIDMVRKPGLLEAEVLFIEEINRANDTKITNATMEIIQFGTINGKKLPNLKCVIAAMNPPEDDYDVDTLDKALVDRFHIFLEAPAELEREYLSTVLKPETVEALMNWYSGRGPKADYVSPRRAEYLGMVWETFGDKATLKAAMPPGGNYDTGKLFNMLSTDNYSEDFDSIMSLDIETELRSFIREAGDAKLRKALDGQDKASTNAALSNIAQAMSKQFGPTTIKSYLPLIDLMNKQHIETLTGEWPAQKKQQMAMWEEIKTYSSEDGGVKFLQEAIGNE